MPGILTGRRKIIGSMRSGYILSICFLMIIWGAGFLNTIQWSTMSVTMPMAMPFNMLSAVLFLSLITILVCAPEGNGFLPAFIEKKS